MVSTPDYILKNVDWGTVKGTHHSYKYVNQIGESITNTSLETRPITIEGYVVAKDESHMTALKKKLNAYVNPQEEIDLFYSEYKIRFKPDTSVKYSISYAENNELFAKFQITGICPNPLFSNVNENIKVFVDSRPSFMFPLIMSKSSPDKGIVFAKRAKNLIINITNEGSVPIGMKIIFRAQAEVVNPRLINMATQESFNINKTLTSTEEIIVNTNVGEKRVQGKIGNAEFSNYYMYKDIDSSWLQLDVGDNLFTYEADRGVDNLDIFVYFTNLFLEVQECY